MKTITLGSEKATSVDDDVYEELSRYKWHARKDGRTFYAYRYQDGKRILLHRFICKQLLKDMVVDHIDGNGLNNQKQNLRVCTNYENKCNRRKPVTNTSGYKGVYYKKQHKKWCAQIKAGGINRHLGYYNKPEDAYEAYCSAGKKHFGIFFNEA